MKYIKNYKQVNIKSSSKLNFFLIYLNQLVVVF